MFYTKYRPQKFSEISNTSEAAEALAKEISSGKTAHAYLFVGPRGTGKTSTARILAKALNCTDIGKNGDPCDKCDSCVAVRKGNFLDMIEIDAASNRGIDDIRQLKDNIKLAPSIGKNKVYIIDEVHMLTQEAFNALLKTLEEPPANTILILCTTEIHKVPETIKSRCQIFKFKRATIKQLVEKLSMIAKKEGYAVDNSDLEKIARASLGGFRDAETLLQQVTEGEIAVDSILSLSNKDHFINLLSHVVRGETNQAIDTINEVYQEGIDLSIWVGEFIKYLRDMLLYKSGCSQDLLESSSVILEELKEQAGQVTTPLLVTYLEKFSSAHASIKNAVIPQLPMEIAILNLAQDVLDKSPIANKEPIIDPPSKDDKLISSKSGSKNLVEVDEPSKNDNKVQLEQNNDSKSTTTDVLPKNEVESNESVSIMDFGEVSQKWCEVVNKIKEVNSSLLALVKSGNINRIEGKFIIIEVFYSFHKERLENQKNRSLVEKILKEVFSNDLSIKCELSKNKPKHLSDRETGVLTDYNVVVPAGAESFDRDKVLGMLDGGLPL